MNFHNSRPRAPSYMCLVRDIPDALVLRGTLRALVSRGLSQIKEGSLSITGEGEGRQRREIEMDRGQESFLLVVRFASDRKPQRK
jgi:hypothetical protein